MNAQTKIHRPLANIVCDLQATRSALAKYYVPGFADDDDSDREWDQLEDKRISLEREFAAAFGAQTGLSWSQCSDAMS